MAKAKFDAKEFFLQHGDRVGLGVAGLLAFLFILFAILGSGGGVSADQVKQSSQTADSAIKKSQVDPEDISLVNEPGVYSLPQIDKLSKALAISFPIDVLQLTYHFYEPELLRGKYRSNPEAFKPLEIAAYPVVGAFKVYEHKVENNNIFVMVLSPKNPNNAPKLPGGGGNQLRPGAGGLGGLPGGIGGAPAPPPPGGFGGGLGLGSGGGGLNKGGRGGGAPAPGKPGAPPGDGGPATGGDENQYTPQWKQLKDVQSADILGVTIRPVRNALIVASYPHARQFDELSRRLQVEKNELANYYRGLDVQRRVIVEKNHLLPDGTAATVDMALVLDPKDPSKTLYRPIEEVDKLAIPSGDLNEDENKRDALAGWVKVDMRRVALTMLSAYRVAQANKEDFYEEKEPIIQQLVNHGGPRVVMRLPRMVRGEYPSLYNQLPQLQAAVQKIKDDAKALIPPPARDPRVTRDLSGDDPFGAMADEERTNNQGNNSGGATRPSGDNAPNVTGAIPDIILVRFLDVDLDPDVVGGITYEYRIRMVLSNPNWKQEKLVAAPDFAKIETIAGPWSDARRVSFQPDSLVYADERVRGRGADDRERDKVPVQFHRWLGRIESIDRAPLTVGDWWIERMLTARGEYVGKSPDLPGPAGEVNLVHWVAYAYDAANQMVGADVQRRVRTTAMLSRTLLVDFTGGAQQSFPGLNRSRKTEDVPAEILLLEPDGRLTAHVMPEDRNDEMRKARFTRWEEWTRRLNKPRETENAPAPGKTGGTGGRPTGVGQ